MRKLMFLLLATILILAMTDCVGSRTCPAMEFAGTPYKMKETKWGPLHKSQVAERRRAYRNGGY
jgi:hypothetical protein